MLSSSGSGAISAIYPRKTYPVNLNHCSTISNSTTSNYDSSSFAAISDQARSQHLDAVGRLTQEVRAATTTGKIQELRQSVSTGEYIPDPVEIAKRMLFFPEG